MTQVKTTPACGPPAEQEKEELSTQSSCATDLVSLEEAEDVLDPGVVGEALHPDQTAWLGQHRGGCSRRRSSCRRRRRRVGLSGHRCRHGSGRSCKVANCGWRDWGAAEREREKEERTTVRN